MECPFRTLDSPITPNNQFFVRTHFPMPVIHASDWQLTVDGEVERELSLSYSDLLELPAKTAVVLLECAGNGRAQLGPKTKGLLWESGAVSTAEWTGVPLSAVLKIAWVKEGAIEVILQGADSGVIADEPTSPGAIAFERSLPLTKAIRPEVFLAYKLNGKDLTREHGFPVRAVVGGWYGMGRRVGCGESRGECRRREDLDRSETAGRSDPIRMAPLGVHVECARDDRPVPAKCASNRRQRSDAAREPR